MLAYPVGNTTNPSTLINPVFKLLISIDPDLVNILVPDTIPMLHPSSKLHVSPAIDTASPVVPPGPELKHIVPPDPPEEKTSQHSHASSGTGVTRPYQHYCVISYTRGNTISTQEDISTII